MKMLAGGLFNYGTPDILRGARFTEKEAAQGAARDPRR